MLKDESTKPNSILQKCFVS